MIQKIRNHFISGLLALGPLFLTILLISYLVRLTDRFVVNPLFQILPFEIEKGFKILLAKLIIGVVVVIGVGLVGLAVEKFVFKKLFQNLEKLLKNIPLFSNVYLSFREIIQAFFGDKRGLFRRVVFVEYPRKGVYVMGFVTQDKRWDIHDKTGKNLVSVFVPAPPNPATGNFVFVPVDELIGSDLTVEEGIRLVISGGAAVPQK